MTEEQKKAIIESGKEYFRTVIIPNHVGKMGTFLSTSNLADIMGVSLATVQKWYESGTCPARTNERERKGFSMEDLAMLPPVRAMLHSKWAEELHVTPARAFTSIELFAGGGGLALGMEKAGFKHVLLNESDPYACQTLRTNRPEWNVVEGDVAELGYTLVEPRVLKAVMYQVPQKRERLILVAIRNDYADKVHFEWPSPYGRVMTLRDAFCAGELYATDVPPSPGQKYPQGKREVMEMVPEGG